jgi:hypothetical protein
MVRVGLYGTMDLAPGTGDGATQIGQRTFVGGGLNVRVAPPLLGAPWRTWVFTGVGYAYAYEESFRTNGGSGLVEGLPGGLLELPFGVGLGYRVQGPWVLFLEAGGSVGLGFFGPMYAGAPRIAGGSNGIVPAFAGHDSFAISFALGLSFDP